MALVAEPKWTSPKSSGAKGDRTCPPPLCVDSTRGASIGTGGCAVCARFRRRPPTNSAESARRLNQTGGRALRGGPPLGGAPRTVRGLDGGSPSRCIFLLSAFRAWSMLLSRTKTCTRRSRCCVACRPTPTSASRPVVMLQAGVSQPALRREQIGKADEAILQSSPMRGWHKWPGLMSASLSAQKRPNYRRQRNDAKTQEQMFSGQRDRRLSDF
jgi:hypothetical protein